MTSTGLRWAAAGRGQAAFALIGVVCIVAGGLVAAVAAAGAGPGRGVPEHTAWAIAYLVLVAGVAQVGLGSGQAALAPAAPAVPVVVGQVAAWNIGNAAVMAGTLAGIPTIVDVGGAFLVLALVVALRVVSGSSARPALVWAYRAGIAVVLVSIPIGLVLGRLGPA